MQQSWLTLHWGSQLHCTEGIPGHTTSSRSSTAVQAFLLFVLHFGRHGSSTAHVVVVAAVKVVVVVVVVFMVAVVVVIVVVVPHGPQRSGHA